MCDEEKITRWAREGLTRREFGVLGATAAVAAWAPGNGMAQDQVETVSSPGFPAWTEQAVSFVTDVWYDGWLACLPHIGPCTCRNNLARYRWFEREQESHGPAVG